MLSNVGLPGLGCLGFLWLLLSGVLSYRCAVVVDPVMFWRRCEVPCIFAGGE